VKLIVLALLVLLLLLQYRIWLGDGGIPEVLKLEADIALQQQEVARLRERNHALDAEVIDLKTGLQAIEERARSELGMIQHDEVYYQVIDPQTSQSSTTVTP
jgi:cell division protein FtsB